MAITKIVARRSRIDLSIKYALNGDKTKGRILTAYQNCLASNPYGAMKDTKERYGKKDGVVSYHIIQSFAPGEIEPEQALEIAKAFAAEHLSEFETVIGVHADKEHIHAHIVFNSVSCVDGHKYHSNAKSYYSQIREITDRLCRDNGLSVIMGGEAAKSVSYAEWLRQQRGQPTFKTMLEADLRLAIEDANDFGHFLILMENMGYEVKHGKYLSFRLRGQERFIRPGRRDESFTEDGIRSAIIGNMQAVQRGTKPVFTPRQPYTPFRSKVPLSGFLGLYVHYLYVLGKIEKKQYPPRMTPKLKADIMHFEQLKMQYEFLQKNGIDTPQQLTDFKEKTLAHEQELVKRRTILNSRKKRRKAFYDALADEAAYAPSGGLYEDGVSGIEAEFAKYMDASQLLDSCGITRVQLTKEKAKTFEDIADVNRQLRELRKDAELCERIEENVPRIEKNIATIEKIKNKEVVHDELGRR